MLGIDVERATDLIDELARWPSKVDSVARLLAAATTLSDLDPGAAAHLEQIERHGRIMAAAMSAAVEELVAHELATKATFDGLLAGHLELEGTVDALLAGHLGLEGSVDALLAPGGFAQGEVSPALAAATDGLVNNEHSGDPIKAAQSILDRIRSRQEAGQRPRSGDMETLRLLFAREVSDQATAAAALGLALRGLPAEDAMAHESMQDIEVEFETIRLAMERGAKPSHTAAHPALFPPDYVAWHELATRLAEAERILATARHDGADEAAIRQRLATVQRLGAGLDRLEVSVGAGASARIHDDGSVDAFGASASIGAFHFGAADAWLGRRLATLYDDINAEELTQTGHLLAARPRGSLTFFQSLGADATAHLPRRLWAEGTFAASVSGFANTLGLASHYPELGFSGRDLIESQLKIDDAAMPGHEAHVETLLLSQRYDATFAAGMIVASLELQSDDDFRAQPSDAFMFPAPVRHDPRQTALWAGAVTGAAGQVVTQMANADLLDLVMKPGLEIPGSHTPEDVVPIEHFLLAAATDSNAVGAVVDYLVQRAGSHPGSAIHLGVANGASAMLAVTIADHAGSPESRGAYLAAYGEVLAAGAGFDVVGAAGRLFAEDTRTQIAHGTLDPDQTELARFVGDVERARFEAHRLDGALHDKAVANTNKLIGSGLTVLGLGASPMGAGVLALMSIGFTWWGPSSSREIEALDERLAAIERRPATLQHDRLVAIFESGRVKDSAGRVVGLVPSPGPSILPLPRFAIVDPATEQVLYQGNFAVTDRGDLFDIGDLPELWFEADSGERVPIRAIADRYAAADPFIVFD